MSLGDKSNYPLYEAIRKKSSNSDKNFGIAKNSRKLKDRKLKKSLMMNYKNRALKAPELTIIAEQENE